MRILTPEFLKLVSLSYLFRAATLSCQVGSQLHVLPDIMHSHGSYKRISSPVASRPSKEQSHDSHSTSSLQLTRRTEWTLFTGSKRTQCSLSAITYSPQRFYTSFVTFSGRVTNLRCMQTLSYDTTLPRRRCLLVSSEFHHMVPIILQLR